MKKLFKVLLGLITFIGLVIGAVFFFSSGMVTSANAFFTAAGRNDIDKAYSYLSEEFQSNTSKADLQTYITNALSSSYKEASWKDRSVSIGSGTLKGEVITADDSVVPFTLNLVKEQGEWKIYSMQRPTPGIQKPDTNRQLPTEPEQVALVNESVQVFAEAINDKSMQKFHAHVSQLWQQQFSIEKFDEVFGAFYNLDADLTVLKNYSPVFNNKPSINNDGVMQIIGHYPTKPQQFHFDLKYVLEGTSWKLSGFSVRIK